MSAGQFMHATRVGDVVGRAVGSTVGAFVGMGVGTLVGVAVGMGEVGAIVGCAVGLAVGADDGTATLKLPSAAHSHTSPAYGGSGVAPGATAGAVSH